MTCWHSLLLGLVHAQPRQDKRKALCPEWQRSGWINFHNVLGSSVPSPLCRPLKMKSRSSQHSSYSLDNSWLSAKLTIRNPWLWVCSVGAQSEVGGLWIWGQPAWHGESVPKQSKNQREIFSFLLWFFLNGHSVLYLIFGMRFFRTRLFTGTEWNLPGACQHAQHTPPIRTVAGAQPWADGRLRKGSWKSGGNSRWHTHE